MRQLNKLLIIRLWNVKTRPFPPSEDKEVLALPEMKDSECHPKPPDVADFGVSAVPENEVKCVSTSDLRIFKDAEMETTRSDIVHENLPDSSLDHEASILEQLEFQIFYFNFSGNNSRRVPW